MKDASGEGHARPFVAIGVFDGVHLGHQELLGEMARAARSAGVGSVALSFDPHPMEVLRPGYHVPMLTTTEDRAALIRDAGVEAVEVIPFTTQFAQLPPQAFLEEVLVPRLHPAHVFVGYNFTFGYQGKGNPRFLEEWGPRLGFRLRVTPPVRVDGRIVSSTLIRRLLREGDVELAARLLGRSHRLAGQVAEGDGRGRLLGFPTANLEIPARLCLPGSGVYAVRASVAGRWLPGVANIGVRPTFRTVEGDARMTRVEVHLLDFEGDLYGRRVEVTFVSRLRSEQTFPDAEHLRRQIAQDVEAARRQLPVT